jgi:hypothetical protein
MAAVIPKWKTHNPSQNLGFMPWPPRQMRSNPPRATTSPIKLLQPKTEIKTQDEVPMKI